MTEQHKIIWFRQYLPSLWKACTSCSSNITQSQSSSILGIGSVNYTFLLWACMVLFLVSTFFDHRSLMITFTTILQGIQALGRTQISHKSFHLKNQLSQSLILQINHLLTQVRCCTALILDSTRENQKQMVRWLSSGFLVLSFITSKYVSSTNILENWFLLCKFPYSYSELCVFPSPCLTRLDPVYLPEQICCCFNFDFIFIYTSRLLPLFQKSNSFCRGFFQCLINS